MSYIASGLKVKLQQHIKPAVWNQIKLSYIQGGLKIKGCKTEGDLLTV